MNIKILENKIFHSAISNIINKIAKDTSNKILKFSVDQPVITYKFQSNLNYLVDMVIENSNVGVFLDFNDIIKANNLNAINEIQNILLDKLSNGYYEKSTEDFNFKIYKNYKVEIEIF